MKERPILFSAPMVRAIFACAKTQTRRVVKPQPTHFNPVGVPRLARPVGHNAVITCPYGQPGDRLWVREAFVRADQRASHLSPWLYRANFSDYAMPAHRWTPSIHMPRAASRITLEITGVRVERLQAISEADAQAEGCALECMSPTGDDSGSAIHGPGGFRALWESINGAESWAANPWVWAVEFKRVGASA